MISFKRKADPVFSSSRLLVADFNAAQILLRAILDDFVPSWWIVSQGIEVVIQAMEMYEGGLSPVECRALDDLARHAGAYKVVICDGYVTLSNKDALQKLKSKKR
jgi:hypothetical protein